VIVGGGVLVIFTSPARLWDPGGYMPTISYGDCPHCKSALAYVEGVSVATLSPRCPRCSKSVIVTRPTKLAADYTHRTHTS
jgi:phage FluMu protein Com